MSNILLAFVVTMLCVPHMRLPEPVNLIVAVLILVLTWLFIAFGARLDLG